MVREAGGAESGEALHGGLATPTDGYIFLTPDWIREVLRLVQAARRSNESFRRLARNFTLNLVYVIEKLPSQLRTYYQGSDQATIFVELEKGAVRRFRIGCELPAEKVDFTIFSDYKVAKQVFQGELTPGSSFINRLLRVEPLAAVYRKPKLTARAIVVGNLIVKFARRARTVFLPDW